MNIHPTAIIDPHAELATSVKVGPYAMIESDVFISEDTEIAAHVVIKQFTRIGSRNIISEHAILGGPPQDYAFKSCHSALHIGDDNRIREGVTMHRATNENGVTMVGNGNFFMAYSHVAHDCQVGNSTVFANGATLGGYVSVGDRAFLSGQVVVHQFCRIGKLVIVAGQGGVNMDLLPYTMALGAPARAHGLNLVGLRRAGYKVDDIAAIRQAYRLLLRSGLTLDDALAELAKIDSTYVREWLEFIRSSKRGFARHRDKAL